MNAIIAHGGKQYRVSPGEVVRLERIAGDPGGTVELADVRLVHGDGALTLGDAAGKLRAVATIIRQGRSPKVLIFKKKRCKQYRRTQGHRQEFTEVRIERIG